MCGGSSTQSGKPPSRGSFTLVGGFWECSHPNSVNYRDPWWCYCIDCGATWFNPSPASGLGRPQQPKIKCYIAGAWVDVERIVKARVLMEAAGWEVTSHWIDLALSRAYTAPGNEMVIEAQRDYDDIDRSQAVIVDTLTDRTRGGREWEGGYAIGKGRLVYVVGPARTPFHYAVTRRFETWEECANVLRQPETSR